MIKIVTAEQMRAIEAAADTAGYPYATMMARAGDAVATRILQLLADRRLTEQPRVTVLVGGGSNGGDGIVAGVRVAEQSDALVRFYLLRRRDDDPLMRYVTEHGLFVANAEDDQRYRLLTNLVASAHVVVDALFGIGVRLPLNDDASKVLRAVTSALKQPQPEKPAFVTPTSPSATPSTRPYVIAIDCPSGVDPDNGALDRSTVYADETMTFIAAKPGLLTFPAAAAVGDLHVADIGIPSATPGLIDAPAFLVDGDYVHAALPARPPDSHKGTYGKVLIVGGSPQYVGAPGLSAEAAYRAGAGLVAIAAEDVVRQALAGVLPEVIWQSRASHADVVSAAAVSQAIVIGPGIGRSDGARSLLLDLLGHAREEETFPPLVIDADALTMLSEIPRWWTLIPPQTILTPHIGEMSRLLGVTTDDVTRRRWTIAHEGAQVWNAIVVLKSAHTLIARPDGAVAALPFKTSALATAGTGDVLAGIIAGLLAQRVPRFTAAIAGGYLHGLAATLAQKSVASERAVIASDVIRHLGEAFAQLA